jgi:DNA topoisomerase-1
MMIGGTNKPQWTTLRHNGPLFPEPYKKLDIPLIYDNQKINLNKNAEEFAYIYSKYLNTDYIKMNRFNKNFWKDWRKMFSDQSIESLEKCDFSLFKNHYDSQRDKLKNLSKEEKENIQRLKMEREEPYKYCYVDNVQIKVGNYKIEPPGIFIGRGSHPSIGKIKKRILPEDVTINLDKDAPIPEPNLKDHKWGNVINDRTLIWLASWKDTITEKSKYIFTSMESSFKAKSDETKFDLARKLRKKAKSLREEYMKDAESDDLKKKQLATALYLIDNLALRVGSSAQEKGADTVGVTLLRKEHIISLGTNQIKLDFLGKDSIRFCKVVSVDPIIYNNIISFQEGKDKRDQLFDKINSSQLNEYLQTLLKGLTAKTFRTMRASRIFQKEIDKIKQDKMENLSDSEKINVLMNLFAQANTAVALLCNHQKAVSKKFKDSQLKLDEQIKNLKKKAKDYKLKKKKDLYEKTKQKIRLIKLKKETREKMKSVSLGTSKQNYIDPRIIVGFIKRFNIPADKVFSKTLIDRFQWAFDSADETFKF